MASIANQVEAMNETAAVSGIHQNQVIAGFSVNRYANGDWMVGCAMLQTRDANEVVAYLERAGMTLAGRAADYLYRRFRIGSDWNGFGDSAAVNILDGIAGR